MTEVFISYAREDKAFVTRLHNALTGREQDAWIDWADIPKLDPDWLASVYTAIEAANTFVFVMSPDSVKSRVCALELGHAVENNKRIAPVLHRQVDDELWKARMPALGKPNWFFFREEDSFANTFSELIAALAADHDHVATHTRLQRRAIEWGRGRKDSLLRGEDLKEAEQWLIGGMEKEPGATELQKNYISASRDKERDEQEQLIQLYQTSVRNEIKALGELAKARFLSREDELGALITIVGAGNKLQQLDDMPFALQYQTAVHLRDILYGIYETQRLRTGDVTINSLAYHPREELLALADDSGAVRLWPLAGGGQIKSFRSESAFVKCIAFDPGGRFLAAANVDDNTYEFLELWDLRAESVVKVFKEEYEKICVAYSPDGTTLAAGGYDETIKLWSVDNGKKLAELKGHSSDVEALCFSPDGQYLVSGAADMTVRIWNLVNRRKRKTLKGHTGTVWGVAISPDGRLIASASGDTTIKLWKLPDGDEVITLAGHSAAVNVLAFSADGQYLISGAYDDTVILWDVKTQQIIRRFKGHSGAVHALAFHPGSTRFASAGVDKTIKIQRVSNLDSEYTWQGHDSAVNSLVFNADGTLLASAGHDKRIKLWHYGNPEAFATLSGHEDIIWSLVLNPKGTILASASADSTVRIWDVAEARAINTLRGHKETVYSATFSPDGKVLASAGFDKAVILWDPESGEQITLNKQINYTIYCLAYSPDGNWLAAAGGIQGEGITLFDAQELSVIRTFKSPRSAVRTLVFSADQSQLIAGCTDGAIHLWDIDNETVSATLSGHTGFVSKICINRDDRLLVSASWDNTIRLWDLDERTEITSLQRSTASINSLVFHPARNEIVSGNWEGILRIWNLDTGAMLQMAEAYLKPYYEANPGQSRDNDAG